MCGHVNKMDENNFYDLKSYNEFWDAFQMFDADGSGDIDVGELGAVFA